MKRFILIAALLLPVTAWGFGLMMSSGTSTVAGGGGGATYLAHETFETDPGTDLTWTDTGLDSGTFDPDYATAPAPLDGSYSLECDNSEQRYFTWSGTDTVWIAWKLNFVNDITNLQYMYYFMSGSTQLAYGRYGGAPFVLRFFYNSIANNTFGTFEPAMNTTYYYKLKYVRGTGANAEWRYYNSTDGTTWNEDVTITNGTDTAQLNRFQTYCSGSGIKVFDEIRVDDEDINF